MRSPSDDLRPCRFRPVLVPLSAAMIFRERSQETIFADVEIGNLLWVWDLAMPQGGRRMLRFWLAELMGRKCAQMNVEEVTREVVGTKSELSCYEVEQILFIRRNSVHRAMDLGYLDGQIRKRRAVITRDSIARFLVKRLVWR